MDGPRDSYSFGNESHPKNYHDPRSGVKERCEMRISFQDRLQFFVVAVIVDIIVGIVPGWPS